MSKPRVLFVPATARNARLCELYARMIEHEYDCLFLRTTLFGPAANIGGSINQYPVIAPPMLQGDAFGRETARLRGQKRLHRQFMGILQELDLAAIVVGWDWDSIGRWTCVVARSAGIPTVGLQEGGWVCTHTLSPLVKIKKILLNTILSKYYPAAEIKSYYAFADFAGVWGEFDRRLAIKLGSRPERVVAIGNPGFQPPDRTAPPLGRDGSLKILYLDFPSRSLPEGTFDHQAMDRFRRQLIAEAEMMGVVLLYKAHPLTNLDELEEIRQITATHPHVQLLTEGVSEDYFDVADACMSFPSTCLYTILAAGLPLIQIHPNFRGFDTIVLDAEKEYGAGLTLHEPLDLRDLTKHLKSSIWLARYKDAAKAATEDLIGPQGPETQRRLLDLLAHAIKRDL